LCGRQEPGHTQFNFGVQRFRRRSRHWRSLEKRRDLRVRQLFGFDAVAPEKVIESESYVVRRPFVAVEDLTQSFRGNPQFGGHIVEIQSKRFLRVFDAGDEFRGVGSQDHRDDFWVRSKAGSVTRQWMNAHGRKAAHRV
jgi:hypothetical protein